MPGPNLTNEQRTELVWFLQDSAKPENKNELIIFYLFIVQF